MEHELRVQEVALLGILQRERDVESRARVEVLLADVRKRQVEAREGAR